MPAPPGWATLSIEVASLPAERCDLGMGARRREEAPGLGLRGYVRGASAELVTWNLMLLARSVNSSLSRPGPLSRSAVDGHRHVPAGRVMGSVFAL